LKTKTVKIEIEIEVPGDTNYVAVDQDGEICASHNELKEVSPEESYDDCGFWRTRREDFELISQARVKNWKQTLRKV
jgi:hypothetical protein